MHVGYRPNTRTHARMHNLYIDSLKLLCFKKMQDPQMLDQLAKNITRCGLSNSTLNYLRVRLCACDYGSHI